MGNSKTIVLRFRAVDKNMFDAIRDNKKKVETRAATVKFKNINKGDTIKIICGKDQLVKLVKSVEHFNNINALIKKYQIKDINPFVDSLVEFKKMYYGYTGYKEKIKKYGLIALEFE